MLNYHDEILEWLNPSYNEDRSDINLRIAVERMNKINDMIGLDSGQGTNHEFDWMASFPFLSMASAWNKQRKRIVVHSDVEIVEFYDFYTGNKIKMTALGIIEDAHSHLLDFKMEHFSHLNAPQSIDIINANQMYFADVNNFVLYKKVASFEKRYNAENEARIKIRLKRMGKFENGLIEDEYYQTWLEGQK